MDGQLIYFLNFIYWNKQLCSQLHVDIHVKRSVVSQNTYSVFSLKEIMRKREAAVKSLHKPVRNLLLHKTANIGLRWIRCNLRESVDAIRAQCDASTLTFRLPKGVNITARNKALSKDVKSELAIHRRADVFNTLDSDKRWLCNVSKINTVCCTRIRKGPYILQIQNQYMTAEI